MKIQDLRDDLAEMRYFKKSYLRKKSQQEAGGPMLPMPGTPYAEPNPADQPMLPDGGSRYIDNPEDGTVRPFSLDDIFDIETEAWGGLRDLFRGLIGTMM